MEPRLKKRIQNVISTLTELSNDLEHVHENEASDVCESCISDLNDVIANVEEDQ